MPKYLAHGFHSSKRLYCLTVILTTVKNSKPRPYWGGPNVSDYKIYTPYKIAVIRESNMALQGYNWKVCLLCISVAK